MHSKLVPGIGSTCTCNYMPMPQGFSISITRGVARTKFAMFWISGGPLIVGVFSCIYRLLQRKRISPRVIILLGCTSVLSNIHKDEELV